MKPYSITDDDLGELWGKLDRLETKGKTPEGFVLVEYAEVAVVLGDWIGRITNADQG